MITPKELIQGIKDRKIIAWDGVSFDPIGMHNMCALENEASLFVENKKYFYLNANKYAEAKAMYLDYIQQEIFLRKLGIAL